ncbi:MAG TPA: LysM peptidoglycan-binding domain-containing protein, partial [Rhabdochlamydiaceae bacterium]
WRFHVVQDGETIDQIAASLHVQASEITSFNDVTADEPIEAGDELVIPIAARNRLSPGQRYKMRRKDTLVTVADRFGVTVEQLRQWNHLSSSRVSPGRSLYVVEPIRLAPETHIRRGRHGRGASHKAHSATRNSTSRTAASHSRRTASVSRSTKKKKKRSR